MPRTARIDYPGALHHVIARGLNKQPIFLDHTDRDLFLNRLGTILTRTETPCYAWAFMPNHFHLVLTTAEVPISTIMQKLLTGHAVYFNKRHSRCGHLFQNRFKSILCQEDAYLLELVRYIHLNPLRGKLVKDLAELESFPYCGHGAVLGWCTYSWHNTQYVLRLFHNDRSEAQNRYKLFIKAGLSAGKQIDLEEGNLVRRNEEWSAVKLENSSSSWVHCERILGDNNFIDRVLNRSNEVRGRRQRHPTQKYDFNAVVEQVAAWLGMGIEDILAPGKGRPKVKARSLLCYLVSSELGVTQTRLARDLGISQPAVFMAIQRGRELAMREGYSLVNQP
jgi:putative transposase